MTATDALRYQTIKKSAATDVLGFRAAARQCAADYPRSLRHLVQRANTSDAPIYTVLLEWEDKLAPEIAALETEQGLTTLRTSLATQLRLSNQAATVRAEYLRSERIDELYDDFLSFHYGLSGRARRAAATLLRRPSDEVRAVRDAYVAHTLHQQVASELALVIYDAEAPRWRRRRLARRERRQVARYHRQQAKRLQTIAARQQELKADHHAMIGRIVPLELDTVLALDAYRRYKKRLDALKPTTQTPAKTLALFAATTKDIREAYASRLTSVDKLADLQRALTEFDAVLVELFDMTDRQRNTLMTHLKEYRELDREAARITRERAKYLSAS